MVKPRMSQGETLNLRPAPYARRSARDHGKSIVTRPKVHRPGDCGPDPVTLRAVARVWAKLG